MTIPQAAEPDEQRLSGGSARGPFAKLKNEDEEVDSDILAGGGQRYPTDRDGRSYAGVIRARRGKAGPH